MITTWSGVKPVTAYSTTGSHHTQQCKTTHWPYRFSRCSK